jgi:TnpA family transposase
MTRLTADYTSGLNLFVAAIILWNTVYLARAITAPREHGIAIDDVALAHLSPHRVGARQLD